MTGKVIVLKRMCQAMVMATEARTHSRNYCLVFTCRKLCYLPGYMRQRSNELSAKIVLYPSLVMLPFKTKNLENYLKSKFEDLGEDVASLAVLSIHNIASIGTISFYCTPTESHSSITQLKKHCLRFLSWQQPTSQHVSSSPRIHTTLSSMTPTNLVTFVSRFLELT